MNIAVLSRREVHLDDPPKSPYSSGDFQFPPIHRNESDQKQFPLIIKEFKNQFNCESLMVADSALYTQENIQLLTNIKWLCGVPFRIKSASKLVENIDTLSLIRSHIQGYKYQ